MSLGGVLDPAGSKIEKTLVLDCPRGRSADMLGARAGEMHNAPSHLSHPQTQVDILIIEKKTLVEPAKLFEHSSPDHQERAHNLIDRPSVGMVPLDEKMRRHQPWAKPVQKQTVQQQPGCRRHTCTTALNMALGVEQLDTEHPNPCSGGISKICCRLFERTRL